MANKKTMKSAPAQTFNAFTENHSYAKANVVMLGVACDITCTYGKGAWHGPRAFLDASFQIESEIPVHGHAFASKVKVHNLGIIDSPREIAEAKREHYWFQETKRISEEMVAAVKEKAAKVFADKKMLLTVGGDHSITNGVLQALDEKFGAKNVTIVHLDAHLDLRDAHEALEYSHASVMFNARKAGFPLVQIGIRDHISAEEIEYVRAHRLQNRIFWCPTQPKEFYPPARKKSLFLESANILWDFVANDSQLAAIVSQITTPHVYISLDLDVLDAPLVPSTGTPLFHGLSLEAVQDILYAVVTHAKKEKISMLGFDITEISPMLRDPSKEYSPDNVISPLLEVEAAQLAYNLLVWHFFGTPANQ